MSVPEELRPILTQNGAMFTTAQANEVGVSNERLRLLVKSGELERPYFGVYVLPDEFVVKTYTKSKKSVLLSGFLLLKI